MKKLMASTFLLLMAWCSVFFGNEKNIGFADTAHPATCALTAPSHSKLMSEFTGDEEVKNIYKFASQNQYPIVARLGQMYGEEMKEKITVLFIFKKDNGIDFRVARLMTSNKHNIVVFMVPGQTLDKGLIDLLKK